MKKWILVLAAGIAGYTTKAQNTGGLWLSGTGVIGEGTGIHNGETPVLSMDDSILDIQGGAGGAGVGKIVFGDFRFKKAVNANSAPFFAAAGRGTHLATLNFQIQLTAFVI
ncbi:MAG TPA: hypothetical protein VK563_15020 [Puia sp.]|nr:hypothetical protein [Puia sp.]